MAVPDSLYRLNLTFYLHGQNCITSFWFRSKPTSPMNSLQAMTDHIVGDWIAGVRASYMNLMSAECQLVAAVCICLEPSGMAQTVQSYTTHFGGNSGEAFPPMVAAVVSFYTAYPGRRTHGRIYVPGIPESDAAQGVLNAPALARFTTFANNMILRYGENGSSANVWGGVFSRKNGTVRHPGPPPFLKYSPLAHIPWTRIAINSRLGTQRHRMLGKGF